MGHKGQIRRKRYKEGQKSTKWTRNHKKVQSERARINKFKGDKNGHEYTRSTRNGTPKTTGAGKGKEEQTGRERTTKYKSDKDKILKKGQEGIETRTKGTRKDKNNRRDQKGQKSTTRTRYDKTRTKGTRKDKRVQTIQNGQERTNKNQGEIKDKSK